MNAILCALLEKEQKNLSRFFETLSLPQVETVLEVLYRCQGLIVFTGVGKSGLVAEKIAMTMTSTGSRALFLSPTNALHGDLGILKEGDVLFLLSKSGESDELLNLLPFVRNRGVKTVGMIANSKSRLAHAVDYLLSFSLVEEMCPFDLAPTTSTTLQSILGDLLAIALMQRKNISKDEFAKSHPAGRLGKRMTLKVADLMIKEDNLPVCLGEHTIEQILPELSEKRCGCVVVVDQFNKLMGIFTDGDLRRAIQKGGSAPLKNAVSLHMTSSPKTINEDALAYSAMQLMESDQKSPITVLPVLNASHQLSGLIKMHDLIQSGL